MNDDRQNKIAALAYDIYEKEGRPEGKDREHWARAERNFVEQRIPLPEELRPVEPVSEELR